MAPPQCGTGIREGEAPTELLPGAVCTEARPLGGIPGPSPWHRTEGLTMKTQQESMRSTSSSKQPFDIDEAFRRLRLAVADLPKAAMFDLRDRGYATPFEQLVGALISARTRDETTVKVCLRL